MATYKALLKPGPLPLEDGRTIPYTQPPTTFLAGEGGFPALSGTDSIYLATGKIVLVSGDPGPAPADVARVTVDRNSGRFFDGDADPDEDAPVLDPNLQLAYVFDPLVATVETSDSNDAPLTGTLRWPDGATGDFTVVRTSTGAVTSYELTRVKNGVTTTYTQPDISRNAAGTVTSRPEIEVS